MAAKLEPTTTPGVFRRHVRGCARKGRCECSYAVVWRHRGRQFKATYRTLSEAREAKGERQAGGSRPDSRATLEDYAREWLVSYRGRTARGLGERTRKSYRRDLERWTLPHFAGARLADVEPPDVRAFVAHLEHAGLRSSSVRRVLAPVRAMFATAVEDGTLRSNPTREVRVGARRDGAARAQREVRAMSRVELARLLAEVPDEHRLMFELLAHSGLRISELIGLEWRDVRFTGRPALLVRRQDCRGEVGELKSDHSRRDVPLSPAMVERLWALGADRPGTARVFTSEYGRPLSDGNVRRRVLDPARKAAGLEWVTPHTFRHTCASLLFAAGRDVKQVSSWLGHADPAFTLRTYVHLMDGGIGDAAFFDEAVTTDPDGAARGNTGATPCTEPAANAAAPIGATPAT